jgi:hypothetical protein
MRANPNGGAGSPAAADSPNTQRRNVWGGLAGAKAGDLGHRTSSFEKYRRLDWRFSTTVFCPATGFTQGRRWDSRSQKNAATPPTDRKPAPASQPRLPDGKAITPGRYALWRGGGRDDGQRSRPFFFEFISRSPAEVLRLKQKRGRTIVRPLANTIGLYGTVTLKNMLVDVIGTDMGLAEPVTVVHETGGARLGVDCSVPPAGDHETFNEPPDLVAVKTGRRGACK